VVVQDRTEAATPERVAEAVESALRLGNDRIQVIDPASGKTHIFTTGWHCSSCDAPIRPPSPALFSFNSPLGACPECKGFGRIIGIDMQRVIPDRSLSISEGVIKPFQSGQSAECQDDLVRHCRQRKIDLMRSFERLPQADQDFVIHGEPGIDPKQAWDSGRWYGVDGYFHWLESKTYKMHIRVLLSRYRSYQPCPACHGGRFQPEALNFRLAGMTIAELGAMPLNRLLPLLASTLISELTVLVHLAHAPRVHLVLGAVQRCSFGLVVG
jgi:excinuclease ABC subunit A